MTRVLPSENAATAMTEIMPLSNRSNLSGLYYAPTYIGRKAINCKVHECRRITCY